MRDIDIGQCVNESLFTCARAEDKLQRDYVFIVVLVLLGIPLSSFKKQIGLLESKQYLDGCQICQGRSA